jgi:hypothetical protein
MRVVGRDPEEPASALERFVPVQLGIPPSDLELAARVEHLEAGEPRARLEFVGAQPAPVRVRDERDAAVRADPGDGLLQTGKVLRGGLGIGLDPQGEHVRIGATVAAQGVQLRARNDDEAVG